MKLVHHYKIFHFLCVLRSIVTMTLDLTLRTEPQEMLENMPVRACGTLRSDPPIALNPQVLLKTGIYST